MDAWSGGNLGATVVTGTQWGDEGKGKVTDFYAREADVVVRFNGGANAGHTIVADGRKHAFHLVPSGIARKGKANIIAAGVALDPLVLVQEIKDAKALMGSISLFVSDRAHVVLPFHKLEDELQEDARAEGQKLGTTKRGIGPVYRDKVLRSGLRVGDFIDEPTLRAHVGRLAREMAGRIPAERREEFSEKAVMALLLPAADAIRPFVTDTEAHLWSAQDKGKHILLEGAQAMMLDLDFGTYPYVTSSNCTAGAAAALSGLPPSAITRSVGVVKAYTTRVGEGPFPTELGDAEGGTKLREAGAEFGTTTGRPRRCGWLDLVIVKRAVRLSGITDIALTKLDVLGGFGDLKVGVGYTLDYRKLEFIPARAGDYARCRPVYRQMRAIPAADWAGLVKKGATPEALPEEARDYVKFIEEYCGARVAFVGVGPRREDALIAKAPPARAP